MKIQITDYGVSQITDSKEPLKISKAVLGSSYGYTPSTTATGITGSEVHSTNVTGPRVINANVVKYELGIEYEVGPFTFGEIAYFDKKNKCVAIAVADNPIAKLVQTNKAHGNSIRVDAYLSMVGENFNMWIESIGSNIDFYVPIISSFDVLPPITRSDPNFYIVDAISSNACATLAYAGNNGIWEFDNYLFSNTRQHTVTGFTHTTVTIDISALDTEARETLASKFYGDKLIEFNSGALYSICRTPLNITLQGNSAVISFRTPLAQLPAVNDTILFFSRTDLSISDLVLPVATDTVLGAIKLGDGLVGDVDGTTHVEFPVTSVNGQIGDVELTAKGIKGLAKVATSGRYEDLTGKPSAYKLPVASATALGGVKPQNSHFAVGSDGSLSLRYTYVQAVDGIAPDTKGNVTLPKPDPVEGLVAPTQLPATANLDNYTSAGLFYASNGTQFVNGPEVEATTGLTLEVIPIKNLSGACVQRYTCAGHIFIRVHFLDWTEWTDISSSGQSGGNVASYSQLGNVYVKRDAGLAIDTDGGLSAKAGPGITIGSQGIAAAVTSVNGRTGDVTLGNQDVWQAIQEYLNVPNGIPRLTDNDNGEWQGNRLDLRQAALGTFILGGLWNASTNECTDIDIKGGIRLIDGGYMESLTSGEQYDATGYIFYCSVAGETHVDGLSGWQVGDLVLGLGDIGWIRLVGDFPLPDTDGAILYCHDGRWVKLAKGANDSILTINHSGNFEWLPKGSNNSVLTVNNSGALQWLAKGNANSILTVNASGQFQWLAKGANNSILTVNNSGNLTWLAKGTNSSLLMVGTNGQYQWLQKGAANTVLGVDENGNLTWLDRITTSQLIIE